MNSSSKQILQACGKDMVTFKYIINMRRRLKTTFPDLRFCHLMNKTNTLLFTAYFCWIKLELSGTTKKGRLLVILRSQRLIKYFIYFKWQRQSKSTHMVGLWLEQTQKEKNDSAEFLKSLRKLFRFVPDCRLCLWFKVESLERCSCRFPILFVNQQYYIRLWWPRH